MSTHGLLPNEQLARFSENLPHAAPTDGDTDDIDDDECPICLEFLADNLQTTLPCSHAMCRACVRELWDMQQSALASWKDGHLACPMCRSMVKVPALAAPQLGLRLLRAHLVALGGLALPG